MKSIHDKDVNNTYECNALHDMLNLLKSAKYITTHYNPILRGCTCTHRGMPKYLNFRILLDSGSNCDEKANNET